MVLFLGYKKTVEYRKNRHLVIALLIQPSFCTHLYILIYITI